ncbi:hypothetical protein [Anianabacter salinae]|uniref:hypothetical protein n=1 Tax=Anianabacter salinae TaxID=2851023 RepID=UPI00225E5D5B|nr:hypothetical protein [Anianabacter salinae]MBV0912825.1 hypothetical protein [Anianabacter salinae]
MMAGLGHNNGPTLEGGTAWRRHAWQRARAELLPKLPLEVIRLRVTRAKELGLDYRSYASLRASTGRDVIAFLFSSNALRVARDGRPATGRAARLHAIHACGRLALVQPPLPPERLIAATDGLIERADRAPGLADTWRAARTRIETLTRGIPADGIVVIGDTALERDWCTAARLGGFLPSDRYFQGDSA